MKRGKSMKNVYLCGGAVRDMLMGLQPKDRDYVVVGSTPEEMISLGYAKVGADFPVFLHPETGDEYALARREKKTGTGYLGFTSEFGVDVTLEDGTQVKSLDGNLLQKFVDNGFKIDKDYSVDILIEFFRSINQ
jgi:tRNA nucleotidyltransferase (CCA-adding enzyme)